MLLQTHSTFILLLRSLYRALIDMVKHDGIEHSGYMAFLFLLSLFPFIVFFAAIAGMLGETLLGAHLVQLILENLPAHVAQTIQPRLEEIISGPPQSLLTLSIIGTIWTSSSAVEGLRTILNRIYRVETPPAYILRRLLSIAQFIVITLVVTVVLTALVFIPVFSQQTVDIMNALSIPQEQALTTGRYAALCAVLVIGVAALYCILPNRKVKLLSVLPGAIVVVVLWLGAGALLTLYLQQFRQVSLIYGSLEGIIVTMLFFYIMNVIFIYGAEFNYILQRETTQAQI
jgi:membrane protein